MRWQEIITEGRDAPLYHATSVFGALGIITADKIADKTEHSYYSEQDHGVGVSLTRDRRMASHFGDVVFVLDQAKIAHTKKLVPIDYWGLGGEPELVGVGRRQKNYAEAEEFLIGPLAPLSKYLLGIDISRKLYFELARNPERNGLILNHPLLLVNGKPKHESI